MLRLGRRGQLRSSLACSPVPLTLRAAHLPRAEAPDADGVTGQGVLVRTWRDGRRLKPTPARGDRGHERRRGFIAPEVAATADTDTAAAAAARPLPDGGRAVNLPSSRCVCEINRECVAVDIGQCERERRAGAGRYARYNGYLGKSAAAIARPAVSGAPISSVPTSGASSADVAKVQVAPALDRHARRGAAQRAFDAQRCRRTSVGDLHLQASRFSRAQNPVTVGVADHRYRGGIPSICRVKSPIWSRRCQTA